MFCRFPQRALPILLACSGLNAAPVPSSATPLPQTDGAPSWESPQPQYRVTRWTAENGLPQNTIKALLQTSDGYLWLGTLNGLVRFDGVRFKTFDHSNTPEMISDTIDELVEDTEDGSLWIRTAGYG